MGFSLLVKEVCVLIPNLEPKDSRFDSPIFLFSLYFDLDLGLKEHFFLHHIICNVLLLHFWVEGMEARFKLREDNFTGVEGCFSQVLDGIFLP